VNIADDGSQREAIWEIPVEEAGFPHVLTVARDGNGALEFQRRQAAEGGDRPDLVILDLNLPGKSGR